MEKAGEITNQMDWYEERQIMFTYSEEEKQDNQINRANAKLVFSPKFIPIYPELLKSLTPLECMLFGFIDFYKSGCSDRFYFTNKQLATMLHHSEDWVSRSMSKLEKLGYIKTSRVVKAGGWQIRYINDILFPLDPAKPTSQTRQNLQTNKNTLNNNTNYIKYNYSDKEKLPSTPSKNGSDLININTTLAPASIEWVRDDVELVAKYGKQLVDDFYEYRTEKNSKGKQRWQGEKFFEVGKRLGTFLRNDKKFNPDKYKVATTKSTSSYKEELERQRRECLL